MFRQSNLSVTVLTLILSSLSFGTPLSYAGSGTSGGGDEVALEFQGAFAKAVQQIKAGSNDLAKSVTDNHLEEIASQANILVLDQNIPVQVQGLIQNSVAYNESATKKILINRARWKAIADQRVKEGIAFHEIASLAGLERTGYYSLSSRYMSLVGSSVEKIDVQLQVDRIKQLKQEHPDLSFVDLMIRLYVSAPREASVNDVPFASKGMSYWGGCTGSAGDYAKDELFDVRVVKYYGKIQTQSQSVSMGPLFPDSVDDRRLVIEPFLTSYLNGPNYTPKDGDYYPEYILDPKSGITGPSSNPDYAKILSSNFSNSDYVGFIGLRTDGTYLYFEYMSGRRGDQGTMPSVYGYCWKK